MSGEDALFSYRSATSLRHSLSEDNLSVLLDQSASLPGVHQELVRKLTDKIRDLESENVALKRSLPHLKDVAGKNVTDEFVRLGNALEEKREEQEALASEFDKLKKKFRDFEGRAREEKKRLEEKIQQTIERANNFESDNKRLRMKLEEDESRIFHLERGGQRDDARAEPAEDFEEDPSSADTTDEFYQLHARFARTAGENAHLKEQLANAQKKLEELTRQLNTTETSSAPPKFSHLESELGAAKKELRKKTQLIKVLLKSAKESAEGASTSNFFGADFSNTSVDEGDDRMLVAGLLHMLNRLNDNWQSNANLHKEIVDFLREKGYAPDDQQIARLTQTFRKQMRQNTKILGTGNDELVKDYEDASGLATQMKRVDEDTSSYADTDREDDESSYAGSIRGERVLNASVVFDMTHDIANRSHAVIEDMHAVGDRMRSMKKLCRNLFEKLQDTAFFLEQLLERVEQSEGNKSLINKIRGLQLDLDQSMGEADAATKDIQRVQDNMRSLHELLEQSMDHSALSRLNQTNVDKSSELVAFQKSFAEKAEIANEVFQLRNKMAATDKECNALRMALDRELQHKRALADEKTAALEAKRDVDAECADLKDQIEELKNTLDSMQLQYSSAVETNESLRQTLEAERDRVDEVRQEFTECQQRFERIRDDLQRQVEAYEAELRRAEEKEALVLELRQENLHLLEQNRQLQDDINQRLDEIDEQTRLVKEYSEKAVRSNELTDTLKAELESKKESEEQLLHECAEKLAHAHELNEVLEAELKLKKEEADELAYNLQLIRQSSGETKPADAGGAHAHSPTDRGATASTLRHSQSSHEAVDEHGHSRIPKLHASKSSTPSVDPRIIKQVESLRREADESRKMLLDIRKALPVDDVPESQRFTVEDAQNIVQFIREAVDLKRRTEDEHRVLSEANRVMVEKLKSGAAEGGFPLDLPALGLDETSTTDSDGEDTVKDFEQFHSFLCDCDERSNKLVQTLKKVDAEFLARNFAKMPELLVDVLKQGRNLRSMIHKIAKYFASQKENVPHADMNLGRDIRKQLQEIYATLKDAGASSTSSKYKGTSSAR